MVIDADTETTKADKGLGGIGQTHHHIVLSYASDAEADIGRHLVAPALRRYC